MGEMGEREGEGLTIIAKSSGRTGERMVVIVTEF